MIKFFDLFKAKTNGKFDVHYEYSVRVTALMS